MNFWAPFLNFGLSILRHPLNLKARSQYRQKHFEAKYLSANNPVLIREGLKELPNWLISSDLQDPDYENRDLQRKIINLLARFKGQELDQGLEMVAPVQRLLQALVMQNLSDGFQQFEIGLVSPEGFPVTHCSPETRFFAMAIPNNLRESLLREIEFSLTCDPGAYFASVENHGLVECLAVERRPGGTWVIDIVRPGAP